jgi:vacuolar-type H+-ATPase subunit B/Vma2
MRLAEHRYRTITSIKGPLLFIDNVFNAKIGEVVRIIYPDGSAMEGEILKIEGHTVLVQVYGETRGLDMISEVIFTDAMKKARSVPM